MSQRICQRNKLLSHNVIVNNDTMEACQNEKDILSKWNALKSDFTAKFHQSFNLIPKCDTNPSRLKRENKAFFSLLLDGMMVIL